ncbi:MAG: hypothetical protein ACTHOE_16525 [Conexibacter sp.]
MRTGFVIGVVLFVLGAVAPSALADVEPNDGITQAEGPLAGATVYRGTLQTANDVDWYSFYVAGQTQLDIAVTIPADSSCGGYDVDFLDADGRSVSDVSPDVNGTSHILYTTPPGTSHYFLVFDACSGYKYQFRLDPGSAIVSGPGVIAPSATGEPNEFPDQAFGPLAGGTPYAGSIDTQNDEDWFYFFTGGASALDISLTGTSDVCTPDAALYAADQPSDSLASATVDTNQTSHMTYTATGPEKFLIKVDDYCTGGTYQLRVDPATAIVSALPTIAPPPIVTPQRPKGSCTRARRAVRHWGAAIRRTKSTLRLARLRTVRKALKRKLAAERRTLRRARDRVTIYC